MRSHTGAVVSLGKGAVYGLSSKQKIRTKSPCESELVGVDDACPVDFTVFEGTVRGDGKCLIPCTNVVLKD
jgi:hypothetical protein